MPGRILVVDDEPSVTDLLVYNLRKSGYQVDTADNGRDALRLVEKSKPDLILLDLMIPEIDGLDVCRELRKTSQVPIIMVTARGEEVDRVVGLELGADDYVCKPFSVRELQARIKAVLRRGKSDENEVHGGSVVVGQGGLRLNSDTRMVSVNEQPMDLTRLEFDLLFLLVANVEKVITRERLLENVWGYDFSGDTRAVDSTVKRLRAKLRAISPEADAIEAVRGVGYRYKNLA